MPNPPVTPEQLETEADLIEARAHETAESLREAARKLRDHETEDRLSSSEEQRTLHSTPMQATTTSGKILTMRHRRNIGRANSRHGNHPLMLALAERLRPPATLAEYAAMRRAKGARVSAAAVSSWIAGTRRIPLLEAEYAERFFGRYPEEHPKAGQPRVPATVTTWRGGILSP